MTHTDTPSPVESKTRAELIREYSANLMSADEIAILVGMTADERRRFVSGVRNKAEDEETMAYYRGRLQTKNDLHKIVILLAVKGSPAAQPMADRYLIEQ